MKTILLIDDESRMLDLLRLYIEPRGYHCVSYTSGKAALDYMQTQPVDLVLLDVMMPEIDGWAVCQQIRTFSQVPIIMLTARTEKVDIVKGLGLGADDYIAKPFDEEELLARIEAVLRRQRTEEETEEGVISFEGLLLKEASFELSYQRTPISLTRKEFGMISLFLQNPNRVFTRDHLISSIWGLGVETEDRTIDSHIRNLRDKIRKSGFPINDYLLTVWGVGYKWQVGE